MKPRSLQSNPCRSSVSNATSAVLTLMFALSVVACETDPGAGLMDAAPTKDITIHPAQVTLDEGDVQELRVFERTPQGALGREIPTGPNGVWRTSDGTVASIAAGIVRGEERGGADISVSFPNGRSAVARIEVVREASTLAVVSGAGQQAEVRTELEGELAVKVTSRLGRPVDGVEVTFAAMSGGGSSAPSDAVTDQDGIARTRWTLGPLSGEQELDVRLADQPQERARIVALARPGPVEHIAVQPSRITVSPGTSVQLLAPMRDAFGNPVVGLPLEWGSSDPLVASVSADGVLTGHQTGTTEITVLVSQGPNAVAEADGPSLAPGSGRGRARIDVDDDPDGTTYSIAVEGDGQVGEVGKQLPDRLRLRVIDSKGKGVAHLPVEWVVTSGDGSLSRDQASTNGNGYSWVDWTLGTVSGEQAVSATVGGTEEVPLTATAIPGPLATISILPSLAVLKAGEWKQFEASATDRYDNPVSATFRWTVDEPATAVVSGSGVVTAVATGNTHVIATAQSISGEADLEVTPGDSDSGGSEPGDPEPDEPEDPEPGEPEGEWHRILVDTLAIGDVVVPDGESWLIGPGVRIEGNLRTVSGTIAMRPGSSLQLLGGNPHEYVGGGMHYEDRFARDIGVWVGGHGASGVLDIQCTPKQGWNRTGTHPTWKPDDEYWIAPTDVGDFAPRRWYPGDPVPQVDPRVPATEVVNVTRDCVIEGPGHIHIHSDQPSTIQYVRLEGLGISIDDGRRDPALTGRYALHLHMQGEGSRGSVIRGVAAVGSQGRVFVPHTSHGVTLIDNVSVNSWAEAFWWDPGDKTDDILVERLAAIGVDCPVCSGSGWPNLIELAEGTNMTMRNSVAAGGASRGADGFAWLGSGSSVQAPAVWHFEEGNVAHNNRETGIRFWTNTRQPHMTSNFVTYRNGLGSILNGAYSNANRYTDALSFEDGLEDRGRAAGIVHHTSSNIQHGDDGPSRYERVQLLNPGGPAMVANGRNLPSTSYLEVVDAVLESAPGYPTVDVQRGGHPWMAHFIRSGVTPDDFAFDLEGTEGTHILIDHADGRRWEIRIEGGRKIVRTR